ncbi:MAG: hypothetical protein M0Z59_02440 [Nitrospiraceae bacterium]|nr:hypothetical protein [Nitrospiraceae bacterium]
MKLRDIYKKAVAAGMENDPRGKETVLKFLESKKKDFEALKEKDKALFDMESLVNPYADTRILSGAGDEEIGAVIAGIDMETAEILLADALRARGKKVDAVISHHPEGRAYANLYQVMGMQADILNRYGVPINVAEDLMDGRVKEVQRRLMPVNHTRPVDAARLLGIPFICCHTVADNMVSSYLQNMFDGKKPYSLSDVMELLREIPEYHEGALNGAGPNILIGSEKRKAGKVYVDMTGGTEGAKEIFQSMASSGIGTVVAMHLSEEHRKEAEKNHINAVIAGHIASDNLGMNLLFDRITGDSPLEIIECSGFRRVSRV